MNRTCEPLNQPWTTKNQYGSAPPPPPFHQSEKRAVYHRLSSPKKTKDGTYTEIKCRNMSVQRWMMVGEEVEVKPSWDGCWMGYFFMLICCGRAGHEDRCDFYRVDWMDDKRLALAETASRIARLVV